jgi:hypothetical protein
LAINRKTVYQFFKYAVYVFLTINVYIFFAEENLAARLQFPDGVGLHDMIEAYAATIRNPWMGLPPMSDSGNGFQ